MFKNTKNEENKTSKNPQSTIRIYVTIIMTICERVHLLGLWATKRFFFIFLEKCKKS